MTSALAALLHVIGVGAPPADLTRQAAQDAARQELSKPDYHRDDPSPPEVVFRWVISRLWHLLDSSAGAAPGGWAGIAVLAALIVVVAVAVRLRIGPHLRANRAAQPLFLDATALTAEQQRALANAAAASGQWAEAVRARLRAIVADLEDHGVLDPRPSRTAGEAAADARGALGPAAASLDLAVRTFGEIWYGRRVATADDDHLLREADAAVASSRRLTPAGVR